MPERIPSILKKSVKAVRPDIYHFAGYGEEKKHTYEKLLASDRGAYKAGKWQGGFDECVKEFRIALEDSGFSPKKFELKKCVPGEWGYLPNYEIEQDVNGETERLLTGDDCFKLVEDFKNLLRKSKF